MRKIPSTNFFVTALFAAALLTGCGSSGIDGILGGGSGSSGGSTTNYPSSSRANEVQGTVERVDTLDRRIIVDGDSTYRTDLRNGNEDNEIVLYYDDRTTVEYRGETFRPQDLEPGDRIRADVGQSGSRLMVDQIEVLYDATSGSGSSSGSIGNYDDDRRDSELRGTVRYIDTRDRTLEIQPRNSGFTTNGSGVVIVRYDTNTVVEYEGRRYTPDNLERGDEVEIEVREGLNGQFLAEEILVVQDSRASLGNR
ncbi:MAG TPA: DUF5666 domain-containing protein [Thermoanaerobaculia bacterium]|nr:DUF5666 domain-containing protein [Thermoanaerobaculia bacterium]